MTTFIVSGRRYVDTLPVDLLIPEKWYNPVMYKLHDDMHIDGIHVPKGFVSDGATVFRLLWVIFPPVCRYLRATLVHDYLLEYGYGWGKANRHFRRVLRHSDVPIWRRYLMIGAVETYGFIRAFFPSRYPKKTEE
jgi:hypothetical protein